MNLDKAQGHPDFTDKDHHLIILEVHIQNNRLLNNVNM